MCIGKKIDAISLTIYLLLFLSFAKMSNTFDLWMGDRRWVTFPFISSVLTIVVEAVLFIMFSFEYSGQNMISPSGWRWLILTAALIGFIFLVIHVVFASLTTPSVKRKRGMLSYIAYQLFFLIMQTTTLMFVWIHWNKYGNNITTSDYANDPSAACPQCLVGAPKTTACCIDVAGMSFASWNNISLMGAYTFPAYVAGFVLLMKSEYERFLPSEMGSPPPPSSSIPFTSSKRDTVRRRHTNDDEEEDTNPLLQS